MSEAPKLRYSELDAAMLAILRIEAALEQAYPEVAAKQGNRRASVILAGWSEWRLRTQRAARAQIAEASHD